MPDWPLIAVRFALYLDLGLVFGWPLFCLYAPPVEGRSAPVPIRGPITLFGFFGLMLSGLGFLLMLAAMSGSGVAELDPGVVGKMLRETAVGWSFLTRTAALLLTVTAGLMVRRPQLPRLILASFGGGVALASLAWNGHAGATEGELGLLHLGSDILHLWAAGAWIGALFALLAMLIRPSPAPAQLDSAHRALHGFSRIGTAVVATLLVTGIANAAILVDGSGLAAAATGRWGQLLVVKLLLFGAMLALAAANRFRLTPRLQKSIAGGDAAAAVTALRLSVGLEAVTLVLILTLVGWLGTLEPVPRL